MNNKNILFICNFGQHRSRTAAEIFSTRYSTRYAGIYHNKVSVEDIDWADMICTMDDEQKHIIERLFEKNIKDKKIFSLDIENLYRYMDEDLVKELKDRFEKMMKEK